MAVRVFGPYQALASGMAAGIVLRTVSRVTVIKGLYSLAHKQTSALHEFTPCIVTVSSRFGLQTAHLVLNRSVCSQCDSVCAHKPSMLVCLTNCTETEKLLFCRRRIMIYLQLRGPGGPVKMKCFRPFILPAAVFLTSSPWFLLSQVY